MATRNHSTFIRTAVTFSLWFCFLTFVVNVILDLFCIFIFELIRKNGFDKPSFVYFDKPSFKVYFRLFSRFTLLRLFRQYIVPHDGFITNSLIVGGWKFFICSSTKNIDHRTHNKRLFPTSVNSRKVQLENYTHPSFALSCICVFLCWLNKKPNIDKSLTISLTL